MRRKLNVIGFVVAIGVGLVSYGVTASSQQRGAPGAPGQAADCSPGWPARTRLARNRVWLVGVPDTMRCLPSQSHRGSRHTRRGATRDDAGENF
jgi:hypothetical protein